MAVILLFCCCPLWPQSMLVVVYVCHCYDMLAQCGRYCCILLLPMVKLCVSFAFVLIFSYFANASCNLPIIMPCYGFDRCNIIYFLFVLVLHFAQDACLLIMNVCLGTTNVPSLFLVAAI